MQSPLPTACVDVRMPTLPDAPNEDDTERDGLLSYSAEWHAFAHGLYDGMREWRVKPGELPDNPDVDKEPHYYKGAYVIGTLLQAGIAVLAYVVASAIV